MKTHLRQSESSRPGGWEILLEMPAPRIQLSHQAYDPHHLPSEFQHFDDGFHERKQVDPDAGGADHVAVSPDNLVPFALNVDAVTHRLLGVRCVSTEAEIAPDPAGVVHKDGDARGVLDAAGNAVLVAQGVGRVELCPELEHAVGPECGLDLGAGADVASEAQVMLPAQGAGHQERIMHGLRRAASWLSHCDDGGRGRGVIGDRGRGDDLHGGGIGRGREGDAGEK